MNFKKIIALILVIATCCAITAGLTMAYMTDEDKATNVMVVGNIDIEQREHDRDGNEFVQGQTLLPIVGSTTQKDNGYPAPANYIDKIVTVENTGKNAAYVRTFIAIPSYTYEGKPANNASGNILHWNGYSEGDTSDKYPAATRIPDTGANVANHWYWGQENEGAWPGNGGKWNTFETVIDGQNYIVYVITHTTALQPGEITAPNMTGLYLDSRVDFKGNNYIIDGKAIGGFDGIVEVLVATQAVQYDTGWKNAFEALNTAFPNYTVNHPWASEKPTTTVASEDALVSGGTLLINPDQTVALSTNETIITKETNLVVGGEITSNRKDTSGAEKYSTLTVRANTTIGGNGTINNTSGYAITVKGDNLPTLTINDGFYSGGTTAINVVKGHLVINGGFFRDTEAEDNGHYLINCIDGNYKNGSATVTITGGTFVNWNPANNTSEGAGTDFVPEGYKVISEQMGNETWYTVVPAN